VTAARRPEQCRRVKLGIILGFTGPIESLTPSMADGAELAMAEVTESGLLLDGATVTPVRADSTCIDSRRRHRRRRTSDHLRRRQGHHGRRLLGRDRRDPATWRCRTAS
jgi:hypothetical protein